MPVCAHRDLSCLATSASAEDELKRRVYLVPQQRQHDDYNQSNQYDHNHVFEQTLTLITSNKTMQ
jgi:hypothetical protein